MLSLVRRDLQDGMNAVWPSSVVSEIVAGAVSRRECDVIVTFDDHGVSGHPNHIAAFRGVSEYAAASDGAVKAYSLRSVSLLRKYIGMLDALFTSAKSPRDVVIFGSFQDVLTGQSAMAAHKSQFVWFRRIYVVLSRFMVINELAPLN